MKKNNLFLLLVLFVLILIPGKVDAAKICTGKKLSDLKAKAYAAQPTYEFIKDKNENYFKVTVFNVDKDILVQSGGSIYEPDKKNQVIIETYFEGGETYEIKFYGGYETDCVEEYVYSKKLQLPKYNPYSEREECIEYEEFPLCNKWYSGDIESDEYFLEQLELYKKSITPSKEPVKEEVEKNIFEKIVDFYMENIAITGPISVIVILVVIIVVVRKIIRRRKRIKLDY